MKLAFAGAGLSCAVIAREMAEQGHSIDVYEERPHVAGNCHTQRDAGTGVMVHTYGPHIFHTDDAEVWQYVNRYTKFRRFIHRVKATTTGRVFSLPINLLTINQFYGKTLSPDEAKSFIAGIADQSIAEPANFEEQALRFIGEDLYRAFFEGYTRKQWGVDPKQIPASILKRLPVRFNYDDNYFSHEFQGIPEDGYTALVEALLRHENITVRLGARFKRDEIESYDHVFYSGPIDGYFDHTFGRLSYRTLDFERLEADGDFQGCAVMNYCDSATPFTRITEHKHFAPWETHERTLCYREFSRACEPDDLPYYPVHLTQGSTEILDRYRELIGKEQRVTFVGRLGTYRYLDMDVCIREALNVAARFK